MGRTNPNSTLIKMQFELHFFFLRSLIELNQPYKKYYKKKPCAVTNAALWLTYQWCGLPLFTDTNLCGLSEADDGLLEGTGDSGSGLARRALHRGAQQHSRCRRDRGYRRLRRRLLLLALLNESCRVWC